MKQFVAEMKKLAALQGWSIYDMRGSRYVLVRPPQLIFVEIRRSHKEKLTDEQLLWLTGLSKCGIDAVIWTLEDWTWVERTLECSCQ